MTWDIEASSAIAKMTNMTMLLKPSTLHNTAHRDGWARVRQEADPHVGGRAKPPLHPVGEQFGIRQLFAYDAGEVGEGQHGDRRCHGIYRYTSDARDCPQLRIRVEDRCSEGWVSTER